MQVRSISFNTCVDDRTEPCVTCRWRVPRTPALHTISALYRSAQHEFIGLASAAQLSRIEKLSSRVSECGSQEQDLPVISLLPSRGFFSRLARSGAMRLCSRKRGL